MVVQLVSNAPNAFKMAHQRENDNSYENNRKCDSLSPLNLVFFVIFFFIGHIFANSFLTKIDIKNFQNLKTQIF